MSQPTKKSFVLLTFMDTSELAIGRREWLYTKKTNQLMIRWPNYGRNTEKLKTAVKRGYGVQIDWKGYELEVEDYFGTYDEAASKQTRLAGGKNLSSTDYNNLQPEDRRNRGHPPQQYSPSWNRRIDNEEVMGIPQKKARLDGGLGKGRSKSKNHNSNGNPLRPNNQPIAKLGLVRQDLTPPPRFNSSSVSRSPTTPRNEDHEEEDGEIIPGTAPVIREQDVENEELASLTSSPLHSLSQRRQSFETPRSRQGIQNRPNMEASLSQTQQGYRHRENRTRQVRSHSLYENEGHRPSIPKNSTPTLLKRIPFYVNPTPTPLPLRGNGDRLDMLLGAMNTYNANMTEQTNQLNQIQGQVNLLLTDRQQSQERIQVAQAGDPDEEPCSQEEELDELDSKLKPKSVRDRMADRMTAFGGRSIQIATNNVMKEIIADELAIRYSLLGQREKKDFSKFKYILKCVRAAVRKIKPFDDKGVATTDVVINDKIGDFLKKSRKRILAAEKKTEIDSRR